MFGEVTRCQQLVGTASSGIRYNIFGKCISGTFLFRKGTIMRRSAWTCRPAGRLAFCKCPCKLQIVKVRVSCMRLHFKTFQMPLQVLPQTGTLQIHLKILKPGRPNEHLPVNPNCVQLQVLFYPRAPIT